MIQPNNWEEKYITKRRKNKNNLLSKGPIGRKDGDNI